MKKNTTIPLLFLFVLFCLNQAYSQWQAQTSPTTGKLEALYFLNATTGYTSGGFTQMYKTIDGGVSWTSVGNYNARDISFFDTTNGYASSVSGSSMKKTTNGGSTWTAITPPNSSSYLGVSATSATTAFFINTEDKVIKATNSGTTLTSYTLPLTSPSSQDLTDVFFTDSSTGYVTAQGGTMYKTTDAGTSWNLLSSVGTSPTLNCIYFVNPLIGYAAGVSGKVLKTTDGGVTWTDKSTGNSSLINAIKFFDENNGLAVCIGGKIYRTDNGGDSWIAQDSGTTVNLYNVFYLSATSAVVVGDSGKILKNTNLLANANFIKSEAFNLYPNPMADHSVLSVDNIESFSNLHIEIYTIGGQLLKKDTIATSQYLLNKADYKTGIYFLQLKENNELLKTLKVVIN